MRRELILGIVALLVGALIIIPASALNPHDGSTGQPDQNCQVLFPVTLLPPGFNSGGFAHAGTVYAGSGFHSNPDNSHAVSQYDVACFQQFNKP